MPDHPAATTTPPPDRGHLMTEQRLDASSGLDMLEVQAALQVIHQQDASVPGIVAGAIPQIAQLVGHAAAAIRQGVRLVYVGAGTSGRLGVLDASECPPTFHCDPGQVVGIIAGGDRALRQSSESAEDDPDGAAQAFAAIQLGRRDVVVGIMAGGTTPYVWGALALAKCKGCTTGLICCVPVRQVQPSGELPADVDVVIELPVGPEVVTGSTRMKAGTATKLALNMISTATMTQLGKVWGNLMVDLKASNAKLRDRAARMIAHQCELSRPQAMDLLDQAGGRVKVALVMGKKQVRLDVALRLLREHDEQLGPLLGQPRD